MICSQSQPDRRSDLFLSGLPTPPRFQPTQNLCQEKGDRPPKVFERMPTRSFPPLLLESGLLDQHYSSLLRRGEGDKDTQRLLCIASGAFPHCCASVVRLQRSLVRSGRFYYPATCIVSFPATQQHLKGFVPPQGLTIVASLSTDVKSPQLRPSRAAQCEPRTIQHKLPHWPQRL